jgi:hypothetical protein
MNRYLMLMLLCPYMGVQCAKAIRAAQEQSISDIPTATEQMKTPPALDVEYLPRAKWPLVEVEK